MNILICIMCICTYVYQYAGTNFTVLIFLIYSYAIIKRRPILKLVFLLEMYIIYLNIVELQNVDKEVQNNEMTFQFYIKCCTNIVTSSNLHTYISIF